MYFLQHALCIFRHQIRVSRQRFKAQKQNLLFLPQKRDIHDNIESKKRCNDASFANYKTGYFSFVYLIGDERHHIAGDSQRTDSLNLVDSKRIYTSLYKTFNAGSVTYSREVNYKWNTLCLPYTFNASRNSTADFYEIFIKPVQFNEEGFKEYYDVTGIRLNALQKGVNIIKTDKKQRK